MSIDIGEIVPPSVIEWDAHAKSILNSPDADRLIKARRELAISHGLAAVFFDSLEIASQVKPLAQYEVDTGRALSAKYINMLNGGTPFHTDLTNAINLISHRDALVDRIRISAYDGPTYVGAHVVRGPKYDPETLEDGDETVFVDDGVDTGGTVKVGVGELNDKYAIHEISLLAAVTKQPQLIIPGIITANFLFTTPFGPWGEGYGFDNKGHNAEIRVIGLSMTQPKEAFEAVEQTIITLGGTEEGIAIASIDEIVRFNRK